MSTPKKLLPGQIWSFLKTGSRICSYEESLVHKRTISYMKINKSNEINFLQLRPSSNKVNCLSSYVSRWPTTPLLQRKFSSEKKMPSIDEPFRHLDYAQLNDAMNGKSIVIDVREKNELDETGTIPGSHHIPLGEVEKALLTTPDAFEKLYKFKKPNSDDSLVFSCRSGRRSLVALEKALAQGYTNAKHYTGGWLDWEEKSSGSK